MKVVAFNGSPRKDGNTAQSLQVVLAELRDNNIETELVHIGAQGLKGCIACYKCMERKDGACAITSDPLNEYIQKMRDADGIIIGSPVYFSNVTADVKAFIDRAGLVARANGNMLQKKVGAPVVVMRRAGATFAFAAINFFFLIQQMIIPGSDYWNVGIGRAPGEVQKDEEGITTFKTLGRNMAWLLHKIKA
ncbi:MAG: flavodoxin family protein [Deltaproteobacteria bacterium]|nr:flavodoxin family protein [Deltaproteobacteria bacterium]